MGGRAPLPDPRAGLTLVELMVALAISAVLLAMILSSMHQDVRGFQERTALSAQERSARDMLLRIEGALEFAQGATSTTLVGQPAGTGDGSLKVADLRGFPDFGTLLVAPGTAAEERIRYAGLEPAGREFQNLQRGVGCGAPRSHGAGEPVLWSGLAIPIKTQVAPAAFLFEGVSLELGGPVFYRGDGTGFCFREPIASRPGGGFVDGGGVSVLYFEPVALLSEAERGTDLNRDGDQLDQFDLGRLRMRLDASSLGGAATDTSLCAPMILQERCAPGSDLDGDGFQDPIFLWVADARRLRIRLFLLVG